MGVGELATGFLQLWLIRSRWVCQARGFPLPKLVVSQPRALGHLTPARHWRAECGCGEWLSSCFASLTHRSRRNSSTNLLPRGKTSLGWSQVRIVHDWRLPAPPIVAVYSNLPVLELFLNGRSEGKRKMAWAAWAQWAPKFVPGNLTAVGYDADGTPRATHTLLTPGPSAGITLTIDAPSVVTGTGEALLLDGQDSAMLRASIVDAAGNLVTGRDGNHTVTFSVVSGPGRVIGVGNGNPVSHENNKATRRSAYHGLARVIIQTTVNAATPHRAARLQEMDVEGGRRTQVLTDGHPQLRALREIVVRATVAGFAPAHVSIPVSANSAKHGVNAVASRSANVPLEIL